MMTMTRSACASSICFRKRGEAGGGEESNCARAAGTARAGVAGAALDSLGVELRSWRCRSAAGTRKGLAGKGKSVGRAEGRRWGEEGRWTAVRVRGGHWGWACGGQRHRDARRAGALGSCERGDAGGRRGRGPGCSKRRVSGWRGAGWRGSWFGAQQSWGCQDGFGCRSRSCGVCCRRRRRRLRRRRRRRRRQKQWRRSRPGQRRRRRRPRQ